MLGDDVNDDKPCLAARLTTLVYAKSLGRAVDSANPSPLKETGLGRSSSKAFPVAIAPAARYKNGMSWPNAPPAATSAKSKGRWFQFSLRTLLILTTIFAVLLASWSHEARQQREAMKSFASTVCALRYDYQEDNFTSEPYSLGGEVSTGPAYWPESIVSLLGVDYFANVVIVQRLYLLDGEPVSQGAKVTDAEVMRLGRLTALKRIDLTETNVTDAGLEYLHGLTELKELRLTHTVVTPVGVARLKKALPNCKIIH